jgi:hypothetical protein
MHMARCFIIQPFDKGEFEKRYDDVFVPAVKRAGLEPYRVDRDPSSTILIQTIEKNISEADVCLADISLENPNVWYEVGFAIASGKEIVLVCMEGSTFPFDVRHRAILTYTKHSSRDFEKLGNDITEKLKALAKTKTIIEKLSPVKPTHGLTSHEVVALALIMENRLTPNAGLQPQSIADDMGRAGYTKLAAALSLEGLLRKEMVEVCVDTTYQGDAYEIYKITDKGVNWCIQNQSLFSLQEERPAPRGNVAGRSPSPSPRRAAPKPSIEDDDEDSPF